MGQKRKNQQLLAKSASGPIPAIGGQRDRQGLKSSAPGPGGTTPARWRRASCRRAPAAPEAALGEMAARGGGFVSRLGMAGLRSRGGGFLPVSAAASCRRGH